MNEKYWENKICEILYCQTDADRIFILRQIAADQRKADIKAVEKIIDSVKGRVGLKILRQICHSQGYYLSAIRAAEIEGGEK